MKYAKADAQAVGADYIVVHAPLLPLSEGEKASIREAFAASGLKTAASRVAA